MTEQGSNITEGGIDVTTIETERLIRWLVEHGHTMVPTGQRFSLGRP